MCSAADSPVFVPDFGADSGSDGHLHRGEPGGILRIDGCGQSDEDRQLENGQPKHAGQGPGGQGTAGEAVSGNAGGI